MDVKGDGAGKMQGAGGTAMEASSPVFSKNDFLIGPNKSQTASFSMWLGDLSKDSSPALPTFASNKAFDGGFLLKEPMVVPITHAAD